MNDEVRTLKRELDNLKEEIGEIDSEEYFERMLATLDSIDDIAYDRLQCGTFSQEKYDSLILKNNRIRADLGKLQETCSMIDEGSEEVPSDLVYN